MAGEIFDKLPLDIGFWGVHTGALWTLAEYPLWPFERSEALILKLAGILGPDLVSTLVALAPSLVSSGTDGSTRMATAQVVLLQRADSVRDAIISALASPNSLRAELLNGVALAQTPTHGVPPVFMPVMDSGKIVPGMFKAPMDVYKCALAVMLENLAPLEHGGLVSRGSAVTEKKAFPIQAHLAEYWRAL